MYDQNTIFHRINYGDTLYNLARYYNTTVRDILSMNPGINPYNLSMGQILNIMPNYTYSTRYENPNNGVSKNEFDLSKKMRMVWEQHVYWTRLFIVGVVENLKDLDATTKRLLQTAKDISDLFIPYYGTAVANSIKDLLTEHIVIGGDLIKASKNNDVANIDRLNKEWYMNADKIAEALNSINPYYYNKENVRKMLYKHLDLTKEELANRLSGKYSEEIDSFNEVEQEALMMADYFVDGILRQFPNKFEN